MARSYAKIHVSIWDDADFVALPGDCQRAYLFLLSQPKMRSCGVIDVSLRRWAPKLRMDADQLAAALTQLENGGFIAWDIATDELAVRTFVRHDSGDTNNPKVWIGVWSSLAAVESVSLRHFVAFHMPEPAYGPRSKASMTRPESDPLRSALDPQSHPRSALDRIPDPIPDAIASGNPSPTPVPVPTPPPGLIEPTPPANEQPKLRTIRALVEEAIRIEVNSEFDRAIDTLLIEDESAYRASIHRRIVDERTDRLTRLATANPLLDPHDLVRVDLGAYEQVS